MARSAVVVLAALSACLIPACTTTQPTAQPPAPGTPAEAATGLAASGDAFVDLLAAGDYATAVGEFDETMTRAMPESKLQEAWDEVIAQAGAFQERTGSRAVKDKGFDIVVVTCRFEKASLDVKVVYDDQQRVSGLWFASADQSGEYKSAEYVDPGAFTEEEFTVGEGEWALPGTLSVPKGDGPFPALVLVHGSGPQDRDETLGPNKPFRDLAEGLASRGIAVLRYEKRTRQYSAKMAEMADGLTVKEETVDDALAAVALLRKHPKVATERVFVLGHSLGGMLVPRIGVRDDDIAGFVIMAGTTRPLEDITVEQLEYIASLKDTLTEEEQAKLDELKAQAARVRDPDLSPDTPAEELLMGVPASYWLDLRGYDPTELAKELEQPMLILQGGRDYQVTSVDFDRWKQALGQRGDVAFKHYPDLNHLFITGEGMATPEEYSTLAGHVAEVVIDDAAAWITGPGR